MTKSVPARTFAESIASTHQEVTQKLEYSNARYKQHVDYHHRFKAVKGDLGMVHRCKARFPLGTYNNLSARKFGPYRILRKINDNSYVINLPLDFQISNTFNIVDMHEYHPSDAAPTLRDELGSTLFEEKGTNAD